ncbi:hypothetical protein DCC35_20385 [Mangrovivirga cuniculi]|uniref:Uncharacterized protein n=1 Tax=Mangrovivirga cuniculi TaxID=2715131 RepID=A0A4D7JM52_9BACT|nr:hypothetical protein DCC35_20385 [Mangrovivirga cuniculi]
MSQVFTNISLKSRQLRKSIPLKKTITSHFFYISISQLYLYRRLNVFGIADLVGINLYDKTLEINIQDYDKQIHINHQL